MRPDDTIPQHSPSGIHAESETDPLGRLRAIQQRLARAIVLARPWKSAVTRAMLHPRGESKIAVLMDPPYIGDRATLYSEDGASSDAASVESYEWSVTHGRRYRIAYCCTAGTYPKPTGWTAITQDLPGINSAERRAARKDCVLFSPACLP